MKIDKITKIKKEKPRGNCTNAVRIQKAIKKKKTETRANLMPRGMT